MSDEKQGEKLTKVHVTKPGGIYLSGYGHRDAGECFEVPQALSVELLKRNGFAKRVAAQVPQSPPEASVAKTREKSKE